MQNGLDVPKPAGITTQKVPVKQWLGQIAVKLDAHCLSLMTKLEDEFGDRVTFRGNDYAKYVEFR